MSICSAVKGALDRLVETLSDAHWADHNDQHDVDHDISAGIGPRFSRAIQWLRLRRSSATRTLRWISAR
jgi:hypothetical protein